MPATSPPRPRALALGLILPLATAGAASAQQGAGSWVDPPSRPAAAAPAGHASAGKAGRETGERTDRTAAEDDALPKAAATRPAEPRRALAPERPPARARRPSRLADTPAAGPAVEARSERAPLEQASLERASSERAAAARGLAAGYLATVSGPGEAMVGAAARFYGPRVRFYGRATTLAGLVAEKRSFVRRWPERQYVPRAIRTACDARTCTVRTIVDFHAANPSRGAVSSGAAELVLEVSFSGPHPVIVAETGRVLRRGAQAATLAPAPGKA